MTRGRPPELGERRPHRKQIWLGDSELAELLDAAGNRSLAEYVREAALAWTRQQREIKVVKPEPRKRKRCPRCNRLLHVIDGEIEWHVEPTAPFPLCSQKPL